MPWEWVATIRCLTRKPSPKEIYCEMTISDVLFIEYVELGRNGKIKLKLYVTTTCTEQPGLFGNFAQEFPFPGGATHAVFTSNFTGRVSIPGGAMLTT